MILLKLHSEMFFFVVDGFDCSIFSVFVDCYVGLSLFSKRGPFSTIHIIFKDF